VGNSPQPLDSARPIKILVAMEDDEMLLLVLLMTEQLDQNCELNSSFQSTLHVNSRRLRQGKIRRLALHHPNKSAFAKLFNSGQDDALITMCGFDHASFASLHAKFKLEFDKYTPYSCDGRIRKLPMRHHGGKRHGRPRLLSSVHSLGLALAWTRTQGSYAVLQVIFGLTPGQLSLWLRFSRRLIVKVLRHDSLAKVIVPTDLEIRNFETAIEAKYPALSNCWGAMDGLKLRLERAGDQRIQNMFYNGWTHDHYVSNLFLFSPDGKIRACYINAPGTLHDSTMANMSMVYRLVDDVYGRLGSKIVVDSAFASDGRPSLYKSHQNNFDGRGNQRQNSLVHRQATSVRQLSEWGMRGLQGSFPRLKDRLKYEERGERRIILEMVVLLYNFRASTVGMNQIQSTFMPHLERSANSFALRYN
jgi:DDE superfamily endonuclease